MEKVFEQKKNNKKLNKKTNPEKYSCNYVVRAGTMTYFYKAPLTPRALSNLYLENLFLLVWRAASCGGRRQLFPRAQQGPAAAPNKKGGWRQRLLGG